jgi:long-chain acyl-CoA synthetase
MAEQVKAVVRLADPAQAGPALEQELIDYVKSRIARFEAPRSVDFVEELPRTPVGKLNKGEVRAKYWPASAAVTG